MAYKVSYYVIIMCIIHVSCYTKKKTIFKNLKVELSIVATFFSSKNVHSIYTLANSEPSKLTWHMWTSPGISENAPLCSRDPDPDPWTLSASSHLPAQLSQLTSLTVGHCHGLLSIPGPG